VPIFFHDRQLKSHLSLSFCIYFFKLRVNIVFQCVLALVIKRKITLTNNVCSRPPINIRSHNLHAGNMKEVMGEITS